MEILAKTFPVLLLINQHDITGASLYDPNFSIPGRAEIVQDFPRVNGAASNHREIATTKGILISQSGYKGLFQIGGPVESIGRLNSIDGCSDTLLISPVRKGDMCLNFLHVPMGTDQTSHPHPSFRFGTIIDGEGYCESDDAVEHLTPGKTFFIPPNSQHRFRTEHKSLSVIAFHRDSDFGPDDRDHEVPKVQKESQIRRRHEVRMWLPICIESKRGRN